MTGTDAGDLLRPMLRARRFDERLLANADSIRGHYHVSVGLEATAAAFALARKDHDIATTTYRNHAHLAAIGSDLAVMFAEVLGRALGHQRGRAGSTHLSDPERGVLHTSAMVSGGVPHALGLAFARARTHPGALAFTFFGDGAFGEGTVHESLNLAAVWALPVMFVCENNGARHDGRANAFQGAPSLLAIAQVNGIHGTAVDARQPEVVAEMLQALTGEVRTGGGPRFLEARCPAWPGNSSFFPHDATGPLDVADAARSHAGDAWRSVDDPVLHECRRLLAAGMTVDALRSLDGEVLDEIDAAWARALAAPVAPSDAALADVVAET